MKNLKKFTLVELLVVVAIIGVLVSLLLPAINTARFKAKMASCKSQLKNIGTTVGTYYSDGDENVFETGWLSSTSPIEIEESLLNCPVKDEFYMPHADSASGQKYLGIESKGLARDMLSSHFDGSQFILYQDGHVQ